MINKPMSGAEKKALGGLINPKPQNKLIDNTKLGEKSGRTLPIRGQVK